MVKKHILVIDDQESMRSIISQMLKDKGYEVSTASDGEEGYNLFKQSPESYSLILADVNMPKIDGFEFLKKIKTEYPKTSVIFLTGMNEDMAKTVGNDHKLDGIIKKPFVIEEVLEIIRKAIASNQ